MASFWGDLGRRLSALRTGVALTGEDAGVLGGASALPDDLAREGSTLAQVVK